MCTNEVVKRRPVRLHLKILHYVRLVVVFFGRIIFKWYYGEGEKIPCIREDIIKEPVIEIARRIRNKEVSSVEVVEAFIRRIKDVNATLNCLVEDRFTEALEEARKADEFIQSNTKTPEELAAEKPLLGVPFTTKDCIAVKDLHHTSGLVIRKDIVAQKDAEVIQLLKEKGAIPLGLTNVPEICMWWESHNRIHGRTNNPYNTTRTVGGSSGGEGCMQAVAGSAFGIGSDIGGSIRMPAFFNGVFGHKPSRYAVSNEGQYPKPLSELNNSFLGIGPMTRHAVDLKPLLKIISGTNSTKLKLDDRVDIKSLKVYYQFDNLGAPMVDHVDDEIKNGMKKVLNFLKTEFNVEPHVAKIELLYKSNPIWLATMKNKVTFAELIMGKKGICAVYFELIKSLFGYSRNTFIALLTAITDQMGIKHGSERYKHYLKLREDLEKTFKDMLKEDGVFLYPTHPTPAPYHNEPVIRPLNFCYTAIINCLGLPSTHIPLGLNRDGLPIGIQVISNHDNDRLCIAIAEELDKSIAGWVEPQRN